MAVTDGEKPQRKIKHKPYLRMDKETEKAAREQAARTLLEKSASMAEEKDGSNYISCLKINFINNVFKNSMSLLWHSCVVIILIIAYRAFS